MTWLFKLSRAHARSLLVTSLSSKLAQNILKTSGSFAPYVPLKFYRLVTQS